jgi:hypothetical protein
MIKIRPLLYGILFFLTSECFCHQSLPCLMLTPEEEAFVQGMEAGQKIEGADVFSGTGLNNKLSAGLYLGGIIYTDSHNWSFWLNGQKINSEEGLPEEFTLNSVNAYQVSLVWDRGGEQHLVTLKPHHTYDPIQRRVRFGNCLCQEEERDVRILQEDEDFQDSTLADEDTE